MVSGGELASIPDDQMLATTAKLFYQAKRLHRMFVEHRTFVDRPMEQVEPGQMI